MKHVPCVLHSRMKELIIDADDSMFPTQFLIDCEFKTFYQNLVKIEWRNETSSQQTMSFLPRLLTSSIMSLTFSDCWLSDDFLKAILLKCPLVESISICPSASSTLTSHGISYIGQYSHHLKCLVVDETFLSRYVNDNALLKIAENCPQLSILTLVYTEDITDISIIKLLTQSRLTHFQMNNSPYDHRG
jgi:hypothetical protein